jgi:uncharacterized membrane protein YraQ (UPF0718 family)/copper chaperone CopZ
LCSCGVIPVSASIRRHGASRAATVSFLLSTPQTGIDSILVTHAMLGPLFALYRPVAALLTGVVGGGLVQLLDRTETRSVSSAAGKNPTCSEDCCSPQPRQGKIRQALFYGFVTLPGDIGKALLVGVLIAGVMSAVIPPDSLEAYIGGGVLSILILMAAGVPLYVCATASVPIAAGFLHLGASPGAALAFLIAGPATNAATFTTIWQVLGHRTAFIYLATVAGSAFGCGALLNWLVPVAAENFPQLGVQQHLHDQPTWLFHLGSIVLLVVLWNSLGRFPRLGRFFPNSQGVPIPTTTDKVAAGDGLPSSGIEAAAVSSASGRESGAGSNQPEPTGVRMAVEGMHCSHCQESVKRALRACRGVRSVEVNLKQGRALVQGEDIEIQALLDVVSSLGYSARLVSPTRESEEARRR